MRNFSKWSTHLAGHRFHGVSCSQHSPLIDTEDARRFQELLHAERMYHQRDGENTVYRWNNKRGTIYDWRRWMRGRCSYNGERSKGSTNERSDDKLRMDHI